MKTCHVILLLCVILTQSIESAKILGIFYSASHSHFLLGNSLLKGLAAKGHEVTMISYFDQQPPVKNYRTILLDEYVRRLATRELDMFEMEKLSPMENMKYLTELMYEHVEMTLNSTNVQNLLKSNETFDLIIMEQFLNEAFRGFQHHYKAPCITFYPVGSTPTLNVLVRNPDNPSYIPHVFSSFNANKMTLMQRVENTFLHYFGIIKMYYQSIPRQNYLLHKYFPDAPHVEDLIANTSLIFLNSDISISQVKPHLPILQEVGGIHVREPRKLPEDMQKYLDEAKDGAIYFSMGSNVKSKFFPEEKKAAILNVFAKLKLRVLWKFEDDSLQTLPSNVKLCSWCPQQDILAHPNIKLFITHGGLMSSFETVYHAKPIVGIPILADQFYNMQMAEKYGYGIKLNFKDVNEESFSKAIHEILTNPKYVINIKKRSAIFHDQLVTPLEKAVYWTEYVLRHNGAYHLRSDALDLEWYEYYLLDVFLVVMSPVVIVCLLIYLIIKKCCQKQLPKQKDIPLTKKNN